MNRDSVWSLFEKTGSIGAYLLYHDIGAGVNNAVNNREVLIHADEDRRTDHTGSECR
jgi:hypothetical protein